MEQKVKVYLAGGFQEEWRAEVVGQLKDKFAFMLPLPQQRLAQPPWQYVVRDLFLLQQSDILFVFISKHKEYAMGTATEVGYAKALDKPIVYVQERENPYADRFSFMKAVADVVFYNLDEGIQYLETLHYKFLGAKFR